MLLIIYLNHMEIVNLDENVEQLGTKELETSTDIHIRIQQRNKRKCWTIVENLDKIDNDEKFLDRVAKKFRKKFNCSAAVKKADKNPDNPSKIIQLTGDNRENIKQFLIDEKIVDKDCIKMHGH